MAGSAWLQLALAGSGWPCLALAGPAWLWLLRLSGSGWPWLALAGSGWLAGFGLADSGWSWLALAGSTGNPQKALLRLPESKVAPERFEAAFFANLFCDIFFERCHVPLRGIWLALATLADFG